ncbi:hypothetical protein SAMN05920897_1156 [Alkalispirochaeta americana]|uniref:GGDEF domain-containing protein, diguanylate cyclase (C-di-GMP synthetase) or its enzymatically inactive variants n=1 Tax=Alkalispirochaeta americana TaxID=159291 RepID=A0A1N6VKM4_9SPIO|nr:lipase chaperone [Alkalispirochaeta americana]SIQ78423.1 hypothetical protein SAMN05920897_1156 [Alkalispirochaeta americana]
MKNSSWHRVLLYGYATAVAVAFFAIALWAGWEVRNLRNTREDLAQKSFDALSLEAASLWQSQNLPEAARLFSEHLASTSSEEGFHRGGVPGEIRIILQDAQLDYLWAAGSTYFGESPSGPPQAESSLRDYRRYSRSFAMPQGPGRIITATYPLLFRKDLYPILKRALKASLVILACTASVTLGVFLQGRRQKKAARSSAGAPSREADPAAPRDTTPPRESPTPETTPSEGLSSGLQPGPLLEERLASELERAGFSEEDLTVVLFEFTQGTRGDQSYRENARAVLSFFSLPDLCFEYELHGAAVLIPNTTLADALAMVERFQRYYWGERLGWNRSTADFSCGASSRAVRFVQADRLLAECAEALRRSKSTSGRIIGFQPDPQKYRDYLIDLENREHPGKQKSRRPSSHQEPHRPGES